MLRHQKFLTSVFSSPPSSSSSAFLHHFPPLSSSPLCSSSDDRVSEGAEEAAQSALPPADLQAAGGGDERPRARLPADESLQADDQGDEDEGRKALGFSSSYFEFRIIDMFRNIS